MTAAKVLSTALLAACLSGCAAQLGPAASGAATSLVNTGEQAVNQIILQKIANNHNLEVGIQQILTTPGMVMMVPVVGSVSTTMTVASVPTPANPVSPPTVPSPSLPVTPPSTAPTTTTIPPTPIIQ